MTKTQNSRPLTTLKEHWADLWDNNDPETFPWETQYPDHNLIDWLSTQSNINSVLDIGCGLGINAIWMAQQGFEVTAIDLAPTAIALAQQRAKHANVAIKFLVEDMLAPKHLDHTYDFVFDRGCFHNLNYPEDRLLFANNVKQILNPGGYWLSMIGSTENGLDSLIEGAPTEFQRGPPRRTVAEIATAVEPHLCIEKLRLGHMYYLNKKIVPFWIMLAKNRVSPARPWISKKGNRPTA